MSMGLEYSFLVISLARLPYIYIFNIYFLQLLLGLGDFIWGIKLVQIHTSNVG